jgi:hypothetical protein
MIFYMVVGILINLDFDNEETQKILNKKIQAVL